VPVYIIDGTATASRAASNDQRGDSRRRARKYTGTAASDISTEPIVFAAAYASGTEAKARHAGAISSG
jgi:hypothetical protein